MRNSACPTDSSIAALVVEGRSRRMTACDSGDAEAAVAELRQLASCPLEYHLSRGCRSAKGRKLRVSTGSHSRRLVMRRRVVPRAAMLAPRCSQMSTSLGRGACEARKLRIPCSPISWPEEATKV